MSPARRPKAKKPASTNAQQTGKIKKVADRSRLGRIFLKPKLRVTLKEPKGEKVAIKGEARTYLPWTIGKIISKSLGELKKESKRTGKSVRQILKERNALIEKRSDFTHRPTTRLGKAKRIITKTAPVSQDFGYMELHAYGGMARQQLSNLLNYHLKRIGGLKGVKISGKNFWVGPGSTDILQGLLDKVSIWKPFQKPSGPFGRPVVVSMEPNYWGFDQLAAGAGFVNMHVPFKKGYEKEFIKKVREKKASVAYLMAPAQNPGGEHTPRRTVTNIVRNLPDKTILIVDMVIATSSKEDIRTQLKRTADLMRRIGRPDKKVVFVNSASKEYQLVGGTSPEESGRFGSACSANQHVTKFLNTPDRVFSAEEREKLKRLSGKKRKRLQKAIRETHEQLLTRDARLTGGEKKAIRETREWLMSQDARLGEREKLRRGILKERKGLKKAVFFDDKKLHAGVPNVLERIVSTELKVSRRGIRGVRMHIEKKALREAYRILTRRAFDLGLETRKKAIGSFTVIGLPRDPKKGKPIPAEELLKWMDNYWHGKDREDQAMWQSDLKEHELRVYMGHPHTLDRWLNYVAAFLIDRGVTTPEKIAARKRVREARKKTEIAKEKQEREKAKAARKRRKPEEKKAT